MENGGKEKNKTRRKKKEKKRKEKKRLDGWVAEWAGWV